MENLKQIIQTNLIEALKEGDKIACSTLRMLLAAVLSKEKEKRYKASKEESDLSEKELAKKSALLDEEIIEVISSEVKKRREAIEGFEKGERKDLVEKEKAEIEVLEKYLPEQLSAEDLKKIAKEVIEKVGASGMKDIGKVMGEIMPKIKGKADGAMVSKIVRELLSTESE